MQVNTNQNWTAESPFERFFDFIAPDADRFVILRDHIKSLSLNSIIIPIEGNRHFFVFPAGKNLNASTGGKFPFRGQKPMVLVAHYDRVPGSPGANDNSAAVFLLLKAALRLTAQGADHWIIIFTDKEELQSGEGFQDQGAFSLAEKLKAWGLGGARIFNFDACGTGDTFIFSGTGDYLLKNNGRPGLRMTKQRIRELREQALHTARKLQLARVLSVPAPFSDDAGFLRAGLPALTITMLPAIEAASYASLLQNQPGFADIVIAGSGGDTAARMQLPETWRCLNGPLDSHLRLTPEYYDQIIRFATGLCNVY
ncbi:MAG: M28 family peptidase [Treponema sp.]|jgi:hypothetical protein|nr:M28 family peptidase [Treponema sp.]